MGIFKKNVNLNEFIDSHIERILKCQKINIESLYLDNTEISIISNELPIFSLVVLLNYLMEYFHKEEGIIIYRYFRYRLDEKIAYMRENHLINSTDIENITTKVTIGIGYVGLKYFNKFDDEFYLEKGKLNPGFILCDSYNEQFSIYSNLLDDEERMKHWENFEIFKQTYKKNIELLKKQRIKQLKVKEKESMIKFLN